jgi:thymidine phosphorylase
LSDANYRSAPQALDSGAALERFERIVKAQGALELPPEAPYRYTAPAPADGRIREIDCWKMARIAKRAGAPANVSAGVKLLKTVGDIVTQGEPLFEIHAASEAQLGFARAYIESHPLPCITASEALAAQGELRNDVRPWTAQKSDGAPAITKSSPRA